MSKLIIPEGYKMPLSNNQLQRAIELIHTEFQHSLTIRLNLHRVSAPLFVDGNTGLNDDLNGVERPVSFDIPDVGTDGQVVHSLAKWKRLALKRYEFPAGSGLYTDMNAIRRDEVVDNLHSIYVDQWDWEKHIEESDRNVEYLKDTVRDIVGALCDTATALRNAGLRTSLPGEYYVNGVEVVAKIVNEGHTIELGHNRFGINLQTAIDAAASMAGQPKPPTGIYSISSLQDVWNEYERRTDAVQKRRKNIGLLRSIPMVFTMIGGAVTALCGPEIRPYAGVLTGVAIVVLLYGIYLSMTFDDIGATKKNTKYLHDNYRCPGCNHTLPSQPYDVLRQNTNCPFCKCQWTS